MENNILKFDNFDPQVMELIKNNFDSSKLNSVDNNNATEGLKMLV